MRTLAPTKAERTVGLGRSWVVDAFLAVLIGRADPREMERLTQRYPEVRLDAAGR